MPTIASRVTPLNTEKYQRVSSLPSSPASVPDSSSTNLAPGLNSNLRCTLPPIFAATDNLRQFYAGGQTPQYRLLPAQPLTK